MHSPCDPIRAARDVVLSPDLCAREPASTQSAWEILKEARGQPITDRRAARLLPAHLITRPVVIPITVAAIDDTRGRCIPLIRAHIARIGVAGQLAHRMSGETPPGGDAA